MKTVAIVGATGAVGTEILRVMEARRFPVGTLKALASARSAGGQIDFCGNKITVQETTEAAFEGVDLAFFSAGATRSLAFVPAALKQGAVVVDNSSAYRMDPDVPLIVPEVNPHALSMHQGVIANPNCVAAILAVALAPLNRVVPLKRLVISTYQSASGAGARAMEDLLVQTRAYLDGAEVIPRVLRHPSAFNLFSHDSNIEDNGYNGEENKVMAELQKILETPALPISVTCVRVPVLRAHTMSVNAEFTHPVSPKEARLALANAPGLTIVDDDATNHFPMPNEASGKDNVLVGRIRKDTSSTHGLNLFISGDQLLKGAALNAVQLAEALLKNNQ